jgi:hypothetical protein
MGVIRKIVPNGQIELQINISKHLLLTFSNNSTSPAAREIPLQSLDLVADMHFK